MTDLNFFISDLEKFQCVSTEDAAQILAAGRPLRQKRLQKRLPRWLRVRGNPNQLQLSDDF